MCGISYYLKQNERIHSDSLINSLPIKPYYEMNLSRPKIMPINILQMLKKFHTRGDPD